MSSAGNSPGEPVRAMLDDLPVMVWTSGADGGTGHWNASAREWFGISRERPCGPLTEFIHAEDREAALARWERAVSAGRPLSSRFRARAASSEYRWLALSGTPRHDLDGRIVGWACALTDIHDYKLAEDAMAKGREEFYETSQRLKTLIGNSPLAIIEWDAGRRITGWTGHSESIFGWSAGEVAGKRLDEFGLIHPDDLDTVRRAIDALEHGANNVLRNRNCHKDGSLIYCEWYNSALLDRSGRLVWGLSLALDVTARHRMEEALRASEARFRDIFETAPVGIFRSTVDGRPISVNSTVATLFGFQSPEEFIRSVADLGSLYVNPRKRGELIRRAMQSGEFVHDEVEYRRRDGSRFPSYYYVRTTRDGNGETDVEGFILDISERKRAEEALREARDALERRVEERTAELSAANERLTELDRLKSQFLASMSHELRTPLNSILGFTSLLRRGLAGPVNEEQVKQLGIVQSSASHLLGLINDLLDVSRVEAGRADLLREPFDFVEVVGEVVRSLQPMAGHKGLRVIVEVAQPAIPMLGDRQRSFQILLNLVTNALKFTDRGSVRIAAVSSENTLRVEVADTGIGIEAEHLGMLFEAFRQIDGSAKRVYEGTGLGLYLCRKLLTLMGGEIHVESEYGKGSRFLYSMPLELAAGPGP